MKSALLQLMGNEDDAFLSFIYQCFSKLFKLIAATLYIAREMIEKANLLLKFAALTKTPTISRCTKISKPRKAGMRRVANNDLLKRVCFTLKCICLKRLSCIASGQASFL